MDDHTLSYRDTMDWLFSLQFFGIKLGLENTHELAARRGNPQRAFPVVHIAGTNGKGSTANCIASALTAAGYRTGLYTSPHLVDFSERLRIDGVTVDQQTVLRYAKALRADIDSMKATFFEATTVMAFMYFADHGVDAAVIETGMGGRLDATNIVTPECCVITNVALDHMEYLGHGIEQIAMEKAGIIKPGIPVICAAENEAAVRVIRQRAHEAGAPWQQVSWTGRAFWADFDMMSCEFPGFDTAIQVGLVGRHQAGNAAIALATLRRLREGAFPRLDDDAIRRGFRNVRAYAGIQGRLHCLMQDPELVVDVAHNPDGVRAMLDAWEAVRAPAATHVVFGVTASKDYRSIVEMLARAGFASLTVVQAQAPDACPLQEVQSAAREAGMDVHSGASVVDGVRSALRRALDAGEGSVLLFGSHYVVGELLTSMEKIDLNP